MPRIGKLENLEWSGTERNGTRSNLVIMFDMAEIQLLEFKVMENNL